MVTSRTLWDRPQTSPIPHPDASPSRAVGAALLTREQALDRIVTLNPTASPEFLGAFGRENLVMYLSRLLAAQRPRGREAVWVRPCGPSAIVSRTPAE